MVNVLFFGRFREELGCATLQIELDDACADLDSLQARLVADHGQVWQQVLGQDNVIRAVNQEVVSENKLLEEGNEIAFFPPVTGG